MALERVGRLLARRRAAVLLVAAAAAVLAGLFGANVNGHLSGGGFTDPHAESSRANALAASEFQAGDANLVVIVSAPAGVDDPAVAAKAAALARWAGQADGVTSAQSYWTGGHPAALRSTDGRAGLIALHLAGDEDAYMKAADRLVPRLRSHGDGLGLRFAGDAEVYRELNAQTERDLRTSEEIAVPITLVLLVLVFGSAVAAVLPLLIGGLSILSTLAVLRLITEFTHVSVYAMNLTTALGLGLAIDYSLFILTRFRDELAARGGGRDAVPAAVGATMRTAGRTVLFSAVTVALAMAALLVFPLYFLRSFAYGGIAVVTLAAAGALLVLPALLAVLGPTANTLNVLALVRRRSTRDPGHERGGWHRLASAVMRRPVAFGLAVVVILVVLGSPFWHISFGMIDDRQLPRGAAAEVASQQLRTDFDTSGARTLSVVLRGVGRDRAAAELPSYAARLSALPGVARVDAATGTYAHGRRVAAPGPASARDATDRDSLVSVVGTAGSESSSADRLVTAVRGTPAPAQALVGGRAAVLHDIKASLSSRLPWAAGIILAATVILLFLFTGSVLMPVKAVLLNVLSLTATFGALVFLFQDGHWGWLVGHPIVTGSLDMTIPVLMFCVAFGLSMDYEVFLLSRIREEWLASGDNRRAVAVGMQRTGRLVTAAAALIAVVLLAFATSQVTLLRMFGLGLAIAVVMDATLVRGILVPAFMRLAGRANWWAPGPLRRLHDRIGVAESADEPGAGRPSTPDGPAVPVPAGAGTGGHTLRK
jgi:RND superfamily putative drug exporter